MKILAKLIAAVMIANAVAFDLYSLSFAAANPITDPVFIHGLTYAVALLGTVAVYGVFANRKG